METRMFQFLFKYPSPVFTKGRFVLLGARPAWLLLALIAVAAGGLSRSQKGNAFAGDGVPLFMPWGIG